MNKKEFSEELSRLVFISKSMTHYDLAKVVHYYFKNDYICTDLNKNIWYQYENYSWRKCEGAYTLNIRISSDLSPIYVKQAIYFYDKKDKCDDNLEEERYQSYANKFMIISDKLKMTGYKTALLKECKNLFYKDDLSGYNLKNSKTDKTI